MNEFMLANFQLKWELQVSDQDLWSWLITLLYFIALILNIKFIIYLKSLNKKYDKSLYILSTNLIFVLGINKQLDLHVLFNEVVAKIINSLELGKYKLLVLLLFITIMSVCLIVLCLKLYKKRDELLRYTRMFTTGLFLLISFCVGKFTMIYAAKFNEQTYTINFTNILKALETVALIVIICALLVIKNRQDLTSHKF
ncbi:hypothetical protein LNTAR_02072 [Lentisphaera araneosa HTCC2155]|jgi:hypothetical protein|uniref:Uncharacterized protein n=1 Tax=Lentisphaera araneosa HTCC2155 TaxID=313628 RepID=A6DP24_9BACT|nr:hypothetical protein [Lentisphaera araneosa]EDM26556.1 hypothetical protein LNTAR_02072 [Lentisphaera araneosa HTCC2155]